MENAFHYPAENEREAANTKKKRYPSPPRHLDLRNWNLVLANGGFHLLALLKTF
ncbi:MAG: hypothetical protein LAO76_17510 [Acidobacteriia bacterium]|nr:hypothetical protein [Terriglobia bacterium]